MREHLHRYVIHIQKHITKRKDSFKRSVARWDPNGFTEHADRSGMSVRAAPCPPYTMPRKACILHMIKVLLCCVSLYCIVLLCLVLSCMVLSCLVLYCIVLYCCILVLYYIVLYETTLHCTVLSCLDSITAHLMDCQKECDYCDSAAVVTRGLPACEEVRQHGGPDS